MSAVGHHDVAALTGNVEAEFFKNAHGVALADARKFWHGLYGDKFARDARAFGFRLALRIFFGHFEPKLNGLADVGQCFFARVALTVATRQRRTGNGKSFVAFNHHNAIIIHNPKIRRSENQIKFDSRHRRDFFVEPNPNQIKVLANGHQVLQ